MPRQHCKSDRSSGNDAASKALMAASEASVRGDWVRCADFYARAYKKSTRDWVLRYNCVSGYTSVLAENHFEVRDEDMQRLKDITKDEGAPALYRAQAAFTRGLMHWLKHDREGAKADYRKAISFAENATPTDRERKELLNTHLGLRWARLGPLLKNASSLARDNLDALEGRVRDNKQDNLNLSRYKYFLPLGPNVDGVEPAILNAFLNADPPSAGCNHCSAEGVHLLKCSGCKRAFYCSTACQTAAWPDHKRDCRKKYFLPGDLVKIVDAPHGLAIDSNCGRVNANGSIMEITGPSEEKDLNHWNVRVIGTDCSSYTLPDTCFVFYLAVRKRRALVAAGDTTFRRGGAAVEAPPIEPSHGSRPQSVVAEGPSTKARAEALTAQNRTAGVRFMLKGHMTKGAGAPLGMDFWRTMTEQERVTLLEDVFVLWLGEHNPVRDRADADTDFFVSATVGDLRPRRAQGSRGNLWDGMACMAAFVAHDGSPRLLGERLASDEGMLLRFLDTVAEGRDDDTTGRNAFEMRAAAITCARGMAVAPGQRGSLFTHQLGTEGNEKQARELELLRTLRDLNLATWALCACDTLVSEVVFRKGTVVRVCGLRERADLNHRVGKVQGRVAQLAGRPLRWQVALGDCVVAARARNLEVDVAKEGGPHP